MDKLKRLQTSELDRLSGYLDAAQHVFMNGQLDVTLDAACFDVLDNNVADEDVIRAAYPDGFNPIEHRVERTLEEMVADVNDTLSLFRGFWNPEHANIPDIIESKLRDGYWQHVKCCFDYTGARIVELGRDVPYVNIWGGFTYILYARDMSRCMLLVGNVCD